MVLKLMERCPLKYKFVHAVSCLSTHTILSDKTAAQKKFKNLVGIFYQHNLISSNEGDNAKVQFNSFLSASHGKWKDILISFDENKDRLDDLYYKLIGENKTYKDLWTITRKGTSPNRLCDS